MRKAVFTIDCFPKAYIGYTSGKLWNGWATPYFEKEEAIRVMEGNNETAQYPMQYDEVYDQFYTLDTEDGELETWKGEYIITDEGVKKLYGIGAYCWIWDEVIDQDHHYLAEKIDDFIYEYDTYSYRDTGIDREEMVEAIKEEFKELKTFQQVYEIYHNEDLSQDEKIDELSKVLFV